MASRPSCSGRGKAAAAAIALALALTACGDDNDSGSSDGDRRTVTVAALPLVDCAMLYIAQDRGLFEKEGLDVRVQQIQQSLQALPALSKGQIDMVASANYVTYFQAHDKGTLDIRIVAESIRAAPKMMDVLVPKDSDIKSVADLTGRKLAVNVLNNVQSLTFNEILAEQGAPGKPVYRQIPFPQMGAALDKGQVDAVHAVEPYDSAIQDELGARVLVDGASAPVESIPLSGYLTTQKYASENADSLAAFQRALKAAVKIAEADPEAVRKVLPTYTKVTEKQAESIDLPVFPATMDAAQIARLTELMKKQGMLSKPIDPATLLVR
ncbi:MULTISPECIES: ABC transporter substrate-binding protein [unclassified Streptomyces]|uniref:ABC transporter substrate-binding protein n=1 Tax=unclassified Streptomyces TaxID=2593676 RepID=UPI00225BA391|nr:MULTISPECIES: ABC transporter substrate-binding protein [unclassified Streptomyces]MCX5330620.1 ABC transporter substrate-binding protein [Streptomyces sp. NBC_00140]MCX5360014.1 ABC transporter substrate-binding protein [Streptomyces sp. NBC_00124]